MSINVYFVILILMTSFSPILGMNFDTIRTEDFEYKYLVKNITDNKFENSLQRFYFHYYLPFFLNTDNIASFFQTSNGWLSLGIKKWDFNDYNLSFGILFKQLNRYNQFPQYYDGYQFSHDETIKGKYSEWAVFSDIIMNEEEKITLTYANRTNYYSNSEHTPANFVLPENNTVHSFSSEFRQIKTNSKHVEFKSLKLLYGFSDSSSAYGINNSSSQFDKIISLKGRWFAPQKLGKNQTLLVGITGILSAHSPERIGNPSIWKSKYETRLYGFSENELLVNSALIGRFDYSVSNLFGSIFSVEFYNSLAVFNRDANQIQLNQFGLGSGLGTDFPITFPFIGTYNFDFSYQFSFKNNLNKRHNYQFLFGISSEFSW